MFPAPSASLLLSDYYTFQKLNIPNPIVQHKYKRIILGCYLEPNNSNKNDSSMIKKKEEIIPPPISTPVISASPTGKLI